MRSRSDWRSARMISSSLSSSALPVPRGRGLVEIADPGIALLRECGAGGERELAAALVIELLELGDALALLGVAALRARRAGRSGSRRAASRWHRCCRWSLVLVEDETGEAGFGARDIGADVADDQRDLIGLALGGDRLLARVVGEFDERTPSRGGRGPQSGQPPQRRRDASRTGRPPHRPSSVQCSPVNFWGKPGLRVPARFLS